MELTHAGTKDLHVLTHFILQQPFEIEAVVIPVL